MAIGKLIYFIGHSFKKIEEASLHNVTYNKFMMVILTNIFLIILSFAVDFTCLYQLENASFNGLMPPFSVLNSFFDFSYFSILTFTTTGFGDIVPVTKSAKVLVTMEVVVAFITTIIVISNFIHIKDSIHEFGFLKIKSKYLNWDKKENKGAEKEKDKNEMVL